MNLLGSTCDRLAFGVLHTAAGRVKVLKQHFGDLPVKTLEEPAIINRFKTESEYSRKVEISTLYKVLAILRAAIR